MAETSFIIENGRRLNLSDTTARKSIGSCSELKTDTKHCLVDAINELTEKFEGKLDNTGGVITDGDYETTFSPDGIAVTDGFKTTEVRGNGVRITEDSENPQSASLGVDELAFYSEYEEEPEHGAGDGGTVSLVETARMTPSGIAIETREGKITLSIRGGLCFEDTNGNVNRLGGVDYIAAANPDNAVMYGDMEEYVEEVIKDVEPNSDFFVNMTDTESLDPEYDMVLADKTYDEVLEAYNAGRSVYARYAIEDTTFTVPLIAYGDGLLQFLFYTGSETLGFAMGADFGNYAAMFLDSSVMDHLDNNNNPHGVTAAQVGAPTVEEMEKYVAEAVSSITTDETLTLENGVLSVNTADKVEDKTLPITAAAVNTTVGNIEVLLKLI